MVLDAGPGREKEEGDGAGGGRGEGGILKLDGAEQVVTARLKDAKLQRLWVVGALDLSQKYVGFLKGQGMIYCLHFRIHST